MELITKELLFNFLFVILPLFLMQMFYLLKYIYHSEKNKEFWFLIFLHISLILCMLFPFSLGDGLTWDLRRVPFLLGFLYGGPIYGVSLLITLLLLRYLIGGIGFFATFLTFGSMAVLAALLSKYYVKMHLKQKLMVCGLLIFVSFLVTYTTVINISDVYVPTSMWIGYFIVNILSMLIATAILEVIKTNFKVLQKLMKAEKLEIVSNLAASISHEVRNPLTTSRGFMQLSCEGDIPPETKEHIFLSIQELDRATEIINDYLTFAKPAPEQREKIIVYKEIHQVIKILTPLANMNNVEIELCFEKSESHYILGERKKLEQALVNIVKNGMESMPKGGKIYIQIEHSPRHLYIKICDKGIGMTQKQIDRLGEPYFSVKENGTGLGMMVSFSIIQSLGGKVNVESKINQGTCFLIEFPIAKV